MTRFTVGIPRLNGLCFNSVQTSAMTCSVLPKPISCANKHPVCALFVCTDARRPMTHSYINLTPSRWCGRRNLAMNGSTTTAQLVLTSRRWKSVSSVDKTNAPSATSLCKGVSGMDTFGAALAAETGTIGRAAPAPSTERIFTPRGVSSTSSRGGAAHPPRENTAPDSTSVSLTGSMISTS